MRKNILIVSDYGQIVDSLKHNLELTYGENNIDFTLSNTGIMGKFKPNYFTDLIIVDQHLPDESGINFIETIRNGAAITRDIPIIIVGMPEDEEKFKEISLKYSSISYIIKPFDIEDVRVALVDVRLL